MENEEIQQKIYERFHNLQPEIQAVIMDTNYEKNLEIIVKKYNLNQEQSQNLDFKTILVLLGNTNPDDYSKEIEKDLKTTKEIADNITKDINELILKNILSLIKQNFEEENQYDNIQEQGVLDPQFDKLPIEVQNAIANSDYQKKLYAISDKHKLKVDVMGALETLTIKLIKGDLSPSTYERTLALESSLPEDKVKEIVNDVNNDVMKNIRLAVIKKPEFNLNQIQEEEVPIPPYAHKNPVLTEEGVGGGDSKLPLKEIEKPIYHGHEIYKESGIEILDDRSPKKQEVANDIKKDTAVIQAHIDMGNFKKNDEKEIQKAPEKVNPSQNIISNKLNNSTSSSVISHDPYHEEI